MIKRKLKRIAYLILVLLVLMFIFNNRQDWKIRIPFLGEPQMPAYLMLLFLVAVGYLLGYLTPIWLRKRRESRETTTL